MKEEFIDIELEDGTVLSCENLGYFSFNDKTYVVLGPLDEGNDVLIYGIDLNAKEFELIEIEDEDEFISASNELNRILDQEELKTV